ncbi:L-type lectin-domain containing receptor kinase SIT2-like [Miscanthus floridulus]|uniref:L-type lectin-domain containing receptor kinase SIT2-like n=1 Tax=Miscanthus floridulus TaxID=154761 RepID=UPI0034575EB1
MLPHLALLLFLGLGGLLLLPAAMAADEQFVFDGFKDANLSFDGMATVTPDGLLMLTNGTSQLKGHAFYPAPLRFRRAPNGTATAMQSFSTAFVIGIIGAYEDLSSHGMAFVVAKSSNFTSALPGQFMGLVSSATNGNATNHLFAVEFDTILNSEFNDMSGNHVGVDVNGLNSVDADNAGYYDDATGAFRNMSLVSRKAMQVWVDFDGQTMQVNVTMAPLEAAARPKKPLLSTTVNLSSVIDDTAYVGFSSATGILFCRHYVLGWSFKMNGAAPAMNVSALPTLPVTFPKPRSKTLEIVLPIASAVLVFAVAAAVFAFLRRRRMYAEVKEEWEASFGPHRFSYKDLFHATDGFSDRRLLGIGGFGRVYRGVLASKMEVAVKKVAHGSRQGMREFVAEVVSIGRLRHRNLVQLLGYCRRKGELLLVYDYMPNGSLDKYLYDQSKIALGWGQRFRILKGVASGLLYLHEDWEQVVVHRDIKASNVLLDREMNARLGDFGLARLYDHGTDPHTTHVVGTMGYMAPELGHTGRASKASDVFAFGAFMLEVACGRKPVVQDARDNRLVLVDWVLDRWRAGSVTDTVDPRLQGDFDEREASLVLRLGLLCSHPLPGARPGMRQIVQYLDGDAPLPELSPTYQGLNMLSLMQDQGFDPYIMSFPMTSTGTSTISDLSGGR